MNLHGQPLPPGVEDLVSRAIASLERFAEARRRGHELAHGSEELVGEDRLRVHCLDVLAEQELRTFEELFDEIDLALMDNPSYLAAMLADRGEGAE